MRITIYSQKCRLWLWFPNFLITGALTARIAQKALERHSGVNLSYADIRGLQKAVRLCRPKLRGQPLVQVHSHDNSHVLIRL